MDDEIHEQKETKVESNFAMKEYIEKYKIHILVFVIALAVGGYFYLNKDKFQSGVPTKISITHSPTND